ncbi:MAG: cob(I)yrinic acid a,c-diamide adenosyltransferase [Planctomycetota bacterium]
MKLYTRTGDDGSTGLAGNVRVAKDDLRVAAYGEVDETNAAIGVAIAVYADPAMAEQLKRIQSDLFVLGAELAAPAGGTTSNSIGADDVARLESWIDEATAKVPALRCFVLPGGSSGSAALHFARTVCRRAERAVVALRRREQVGEHALIYLNRLSDLLFALARLSNRQAGLDDVPWIAPNASRQR